ncbi:MAG: hypothetical protein H2058_09790 [Muricauda sp.]|nr:hypothetical protein [Allomuricauda sp.]MBA4745541.1 hypothetical protein [Allomuricauda sp.]
MVKLYFPLCILLINLNCEPRQESNAKKTNFEESNIIGDTINNSKTLDLLDNLFSFKIYSINDSIYFENQVLKPYFGSIKNRTSFDKYYIKMDDFNSRISSMYLLKNKEAVIVHFKLCHLLSNDLDDSLTKKLIYITESTYLLDGGDKRILKFYCNKENIVVLGFNMPISIESIHPKCNYNKESIPIFFDMVAISEKRNFIKNFSLLNYKFHTPEIVSKLKEVCE